MALLDAAEAAGARIHFDRRLESVDRKMSTMQLCDEAGSVHEHTAPLLIGADGAGSVLRAAMAQVTALGERFEPLDHGYKELEIPANFSFPCAAGEGGRVVPGAGMQHVVVIRGKLRGRHRRNRTAARALTGQAYIGNRAAAAVVQPVYGLLAVCVRRTGMGGKKLTMCSGPTEPGPRVSYPAVLPSQKRGQDSSASRQGLGVVPRQWGATLSA